MTNHSRSRVFNLPLSHLFTDYLYFDSALFPCWWVCFKYLRTIWHLPWLTFALHALVWPNKRSVDENSKVARCSKTSFPNRNPLFIENFVCDYAPNPLPNGCNVLGDEGQSSENLSWFCTWFAFTRYNAVFTGKFVITGRYFGYREDEKIGNSWITFRVPWTRKTLREKSKNFTFSEESNFDSFWISRIQKKSEEKEVSFHFWGSSRKEISRMKRIKTNPKNRLTKKKLKKLIMISLHGSKKLVRFFPIRKKTHT